MLRLVFPITFCMLPVNAQDAGPRDHEAGTRACRFRPIILNCQYSSWRRVNSDNFAGIRGAVAEQNFKGRMGEQQEKSERVRGKIRMASRLTQLHAVAAASYAIRFDYSCPYVSVGNVMTRPRLQLRSR
jgi:hypothetical protein